MKAEELLNLYDRWQQQIGEVRAYEDFLDVENNPAEAATYESMLRERFERYKTFDREYKASTDEERERLKVIVRARIIKK